LGSLTWENNGLAIVVGHVCRTCDRDSHDICLCVAWVCGKLA
jgi:hypothetical protein